MDDREEFGGALIGVLLAVLLSIPLWYGIYSVTSHASLESVSRVAAGGLLVLGSWLILRACRELDR